MKKVALAGCLLVLIGSFFPLVHIPLIGNWNYWKLDQGLSIIVWSLTLAAFVSILLDKVRFSRIFGIVLLVLFVVTLYAIKSKSIDFFSFIPLKKIRNVMVDLVKPSWGWFIEFIGVFLILLAKNNKNKSLEL
ncbi:hypothetical protein GNY06_06315 [Elizabethkingia argentiflava]|uniref:Uncharacterized protein n=1 Tax=Elizabethkingia argenteiflava TaxID=2681556 RepID=A0A845PXD6_9FLAO|nr:hypothetical protein [Elizabethkingia argenteiflava]